MTQYVKFPDGRTFGPFSSKAEARVNLCARFSRSRLPRGSVFSTAPFAERPDVGADPYGQKETEVAEAVARAEAVRGEFKRRVVRALPVVPVRPDDIAALSRGLQGWKLADAIYRRATHAWNADRANVVLPNVVFEGRPGTGKTFFCANYFLEEIGRAPIRCQLHDDSDAAATGGGHWTMQRDGFAWMYGHCARAWLEGRPLVIDEIGRANGGVLDALLQFLERPESASATLDNGERIAPEPGFHVRATTNGTFNDLDPALRDRFLCSVKIDRPHPDALKMLPEDVRRAAKGWTAGGATTTVRQWRNFAELRAYAGNAVAARAIFGDSAKDLLTALQIAASADPGVKEAPETTPSECERCLECNACGCPECMEAARECAKGGHE